MIDYTLYLVTDDPSRYSGNWLDNVVAAVEGGVTCVQYRDTESLPNERLARARALRDALRGRAAFIVNNDAELAATVRADGVHVGQHDLPPAAVRKIVGPTCEIGLSITRLDDLRRACRRDFDRIGTEGLLAEERDEKLRHAGGRGAGWAASQFDFVDAVGIGPVFDARKTKADAADALGLAGLAEIVGACLQISDERETSNLGLGNLANQTISNLKSNNRLPLVAIGGITLANAADVFSTGADGLAVVSAFSKSADPFATARAFREIARAAGRA